jgi:hypothetical protein
VSESCHFSRSGLGTPAGAGRLWAFLCS